ncbi:MAG: undecaprenyldiphospho-muramoylpentapeptide beta-N-acetylglucosaminyltransferase [Mariprofundus sp.]
MMPSSVMSSVSLCIAGGGTGGHVMPALTLADAAREAWPGLNVDFIGAERGLEARMLPEHGEDVMLLAMHSIQGAGLLQKLRVLGWELPRAIMAIRKHWKHNRPALVIGVGGYASVAGILAAIISRIPVLLYEQNAIPGLVNRRLVRFSKAIMLGFAGAAHWLPAEKCRITGNIVRKSIEQVGWQAHTPPHLLVLGGSQGASFLNKTVPHACRILKEQGHEFQVTHIAGSYENAVGQVRADYEQAGIKARVMEFCDTMPDFYASGDLMIARSGAMTVGEAQACGMPGIFIPLPHAADHHQFYNAKASSDNGGAIIIEQDSCTAANLADHLSELLFAPSRLSLMSQAAKSAAPFSAKKLQLQAVQSCLPQLAEAVA